MTDPLNQWTPPGDEEWSRPVWVNPAMVFYLQSERDGSTIIIGASSGPNSFLHVREDIATVQRHLGKG